MGEFKSNKSKSLGWWYHKIMCELWYKLRGSCSRYHKHLNIMVAFYGINLYGENHVESEVVVNRFKQRYNSFWKRL